MPPPSLHTLFLDAGGVICHPSWSRVSAVLAAHGVDVSAEVLARAEPHAKKEIDEATVIRATTDAARGWLYFDKVLAHARIPRSETTDAALADLREYHRTENLWEHVTDDVRPVLRRLKALGLTLVVVSNANGRLRHLFDRLELTPHFDVVLDSHEWAVEKPDPRLFQIALERSGSRPESTIHVGDLFHVDVAGARAAGLREGILLDAAGLYPHTDCSRIRRLEDLTRLVTDGLARPAPRAAPAPQAP
jgi:HAD superfamily hydrolase (TIGR01509 family)